MGLPMVDPEYPDWKVPARLRANARALRRNSTDAERVLWSELRAGRLNGAGFRRQVPIDSYIADFICHAAKLVIELDGGQHVEQAQYDRQRERDMQELGFQTLRFWDHEVLKETDAVMEKIRQVAQALALTPALSRKREREQDQAPSAQRERVQDKRNERS